MTKNIRDLIKKLGENAKKANAEMCQISTDMKNKSLRKLYLRLKKKNHID